jgi:4-phytase/acid phosphatase
MQFLGAYYRQYLTRAGLLASSGCADLRRFYFWSDTVGRDIESAWTLGRAMMPGCDITIHRLGEGNPDPLFAPRAAGVGKLDFAMAREAYLAKVGRSPEAVIDNYRADFELVEEILFGCKASPTCPPAGTEVKKRIPKQPALALPENGPPSSPAINAAHAVAEAIVLEYLNGVDEKQIGWGRVDAAKLGELLKFEARWWDSVTTLYASRAALSNLLSHLLRSLEQAVTGSAVPGAIGNPGDKALFLMGHDGDIKRIAVMLGLSWELEKRGRTNEAPPGASLMFEVWRDRTSDKRTVRIYLQTQTFEQIRRLTPLSLTTPPTRVPLVLPACAGPAGDARCGWEQFRASVAASIDPAFVQPTAAGGR